MRFWKLALMAALAVMVVMFGFGFDASKSGCYSGAGGATMSGVGFQNGARAEVKIQILGDGTLYAAAIKLSDEGEDDNDDENDDENDSDDENDNDENDNDDEDNDDENDDNDDDDDDNDNEGNKDEFDAQVEIVAADYSYFVVFGSLVVEKEADDGDEQKAENEEGEENETDYEIPDLTVGTWVEVKGTFDPKVGIFYAEEIHGQESGETEYEIESVVSNLTGSSFTMLGLTITYDENTQFESEDNDDCEQEGEHEGENENC